MAEYKSFKRLNFFRGFLVTEDDWNEGEKYHILKRQLHNTVLHAPGVVPHFLGGLRVTQKDRGDMNVVIANGYAVDGSGRDIFLPEPVIKTINPADFQLEPGKNYVTVYVVASYTEEPTDFVTYKENLQFKGHKRITEGVKISVTAAEPDITKEVELARIQLTKDARQIKDAVDPFAPRPNEIDLRFVPIAGIAGSFLRPALKAELMSLLLAEQEVYAYLAHEMKVSTALDVLHANLTMQMLLASDYVDFRNIFHLLFMLLMLQRTMIGYVEQEQPEMSKTKEFGTYKWNVTSVKLDRRYSMELLLDIISTQRNATEALKALFAHALKPKLKVEEKPEAAWEIIWEKIKVRSEDFTETLSYEGRDFKRMDMIDIYDEASEKKHHFAIIDERDRYRSRQKLKYPDGVMVEDVGVHFEGGYAQFEIYNLEPARDVILITRIDYVRGDYECEVTINGKKAANLVVPGNDMVFRWRNWPYVIPAEMVTEPVLRIQIKPIYEDRDVNFFHIWVYQPL